MTVATLALEGSRKGFGQINPARRAMYNRMSLNRLKELSREISLSEIEREYVKQNIMLVQLARGVIS